MLHSGDPADTTMTSRSDGIGVVLHRTELLVHGGWAAHLVWALSLPSLEWEERTTSGAIPSARCFHAVVSWDDDHIAVLGGENLAAGEQCGALMDVHLLHVRSGRWTRLDLAGAVPMARSHHSATNVGGAVVVLGGRPITKHQLTESAMYSLFRDGFYDVYVLPRNTTTWQRVAVDAPGVPLLWGHSASWYRGPAGDFVVVFGGVALSLRFDPASDAPVGAEFSDRVLVLSMASLRWTAIEPRAAAVAPPGRALHCAHLHERQLVVFGGTGFATEHPTPAVGGAAAHQPAPLSDAWLWDVESGSWSQLPALGTLRWQSSRVLSGVYDGQLVVANNMRALHYARFGDGLCCWHEVRCTMDARRFVHKSPLEAANTTTAPRSPLPPSSATFMLEQARRTREAADESARAAAAAARGGTGPLDVRLLRDEVQRLKVALEQPPHAASGGAESAIPLPLSRASPLSLSPSPRVVRATAASSPTTAKTSDEDRTQLRPAIRAIVEQTLGPNAFRHVPRQAAPALPSPRASPRPGVGPVVDANLPESIVAFRRLRDDRGAARRRHTSRLGAIEDDIRTIQRGVAPPPWPQGVETADRRAFETAQPRDFSTFGDELLPSFRRRRRTGATGQPH